MSVAERLAEIAGLGKDPVRGGYSRHVFEPAELALREWFHRSASALGLSVETDGNANMWAWWGPPGEGAVATGSHLDSVPGGGAYDGPLGVASALEAVAILKAEGWTPKRPLVITVFAEEEGSRFGMPCLGSRLLVGEIAAGAARSRTDRHGVALEEVWRAAGLDPADIGADPSRVANIGAFIELHVEQGLDLEQRGEPLAVAAAIMSHGRWRLGMSGEGNHAGTTPINARHDPVVAAAGAILAVRDVATEHSSRGTVGRVEVTPNGTNVIASRVDAWLDIRAHDDTAVRSQLAETIDRVEKCVEAEGCHLTVEEESFSSLVVFDEHLTSQVAELLGGVPAIATGAGHDAGILSPYVPTAMLFVRNPTGVSHAPVEAARAEDCEAGARALAVVLRELAGARQR